MTFVRWSSALRAGLLAVIVAGLAGAPLGAQQGGDPVERVLLTAGRSTVLMTDFDITRIAVTDPAIADAVVV